MDVVTFKERIEQLSSYLAVMPDFRGFNTPLTNAKIQTIVENAVPQDWRISQIKTGRGAEMELNESVEYFRSLESIEAPRAPPHIGKSGAKKSSATSHSGGFASSNSN
jgi:hypothetical protein